MNVRCTCCGQTIDVGDLTSALERLKLRRLQRRIVDILLKRKGNWVHKSSVVDAMYGDDMDGGPDNAENAAEYNISKMRAKLATIGLAIESMRHVGYRVVHCDPVKETAGATPLPTQVNRRPDLSAYRRLKQSRRTRHGLSDAGGEWGLVR